MKYKAGDKVRVKKFDERPEHWNHDGEMDKYMGKIVTIEEADESLNGYYVYEEGADRFWYFIESDFEGTVNAMTKDDLKTGMVVEYRNGDKGILIKQLNSIMGIEESLSLKDFDDNLKCNSGCEEYNIQKVFIVDLPLPFKALFQEDYGGNYLTLIWEREEPKEMTIEEVEQELGYQVKIVEEKEV